MGGGLCGPTEGLESSDTHARVYLRETKSSNALHAPLKKPQTDHKQAGGSNQKDEEDVPDQEAIAKDVVASATSTSNRPKVHDLFHIMMSIPFRGLPKYHSTDA